MRTTLHDYNGASLLFPMNEGDHIGFPELLVSTLIARKYEVPAWRESSSNGPDQKKIVVYSARELNVNRFETVITEPVQEKTEQWKQWSTAIRSEFALLDPNQYEDLSVALKDGIKGVQLRRSQKQRGAVVPMSVPLALLQNSRGALGKGGPANFGLILEQIFSLGCQYQNSESASDYLVSAFSIQSEMDALIRALNSAIKQGIIEGGSIDEVTNSPHFLGSKQIFPGEDSPFGWFAKIWPRLTSREWVMALPTRRWVDWATTVLRLTLGLSILWESRWYEELGYEISSSSSEILDPSRIVRSINSKAMMTWHSQSTDERSRNVQQEIRSTLTAGFHVKEILKNEFSGNSELLTSNLEKLTKELRSPRLLRELANKRKLSYSATRKSTLTHRWDAIDSCLTTRETSDGNEVDHYGLLVAKSSGTSSFRVIEPSTELIAVIASLSCGIPEGECRIGDVRNDLRSLGLRPALGELVSQLEKAGLSNRIADADDSGIVRSAFSKGNRS